MAARNPGQRRPVFHDETYARLREGVADGLAEVGQRVLDVARPHVPDRPPLGEGLIETGRYAVTVDGERVAGTADVPEDAPKGIALFVGYDFPGFFLEGGTIHITPRPWLTPAFSAVGRTAPATAAAAAQRKVGR